MHPEDPHNIGAALEELVWYRRLMLSRSCFSLIAVFSGTYLLVTSLFVERGADGLAEIVVPFALCTAASLTIIVDYFLFWQHEI